MSDNSPSPAARAQAARGITILIALQEARDERQQVLRELRNKLFVSSTDPRRQRLMECQEDLAHQIHELDASLGPEPLPGS
ncbi:MAG: hypothetical protein R6U63_10830 [Longimicrobiales bacterium]